MKREYNYNRTTCSIDAFFGQQIALFSLIAEAHSNNTLYGKIQRCIAIFKDVWLVHEEKIATKGGMDCNPYCTL